MLYQSLSQPQPLAYQLTQPNTNPHPPSFSHSQPNPQPHPQPPPYHQPPPPPSTTYQLITGRLTRSIQNVFSQASAMLLADDPNASQLFEQLEALTIASDQALLYLIDTDGLLQLESANVYAPSLPLSMSSSREEYWRSAYDVTRQQWAVMDAMRSRHSALKQAAADFWPAPLQSSPVSAMALADSAYAASSPAPHSAKQQEEQMDDTSPAPSSAEPPPTTADTPATTDTQPSPITAANNEASDPIDLTAPATDTDTASPTITSPPQPPTTEPAATPPAPHSSGGADSMTDVDSGAGASESAATAGVSELAGCCRKGRWWWEGLGRG